MAGRLSRKAEGGPGARASSALEGRLPAGSLEQDGGCVPLGHCECTDAQGHSWAPGSQHQEACNNCTCRAGQLSCTTQPCPPPAHCAWSRWSAWSPCSRSCGPAGQQSRFRYGAMPGLCHLGPPGPPAAWTWSPGLPGFWILSPPVTLCPPRDLALALVPSHPCLSLGTSTPALGFPRGGRRRDKGPGTISHLLHPGAPPRSSTSDSWAPECREEQSQSQPCPQPPCPPLCLQGTHPRSLGDSWQQDGCQQW